MRAPFLTGLTLGVGLALAATAALAEPVHGIAMHGEPKYETGFTHLEYVNPHAPKGGALRLALAGSFDSLNPFLIKGSAAAGRHYVFESLLKRTWDEAFSLYGLIAESLEVPADRSWVTFHLRPEARFHDGSPITTEDVIFSLETLRDFGRPNHRLYYGQVARIDQADSRTLTFFFDPQSGNRELPLLIGLMPILSKDYYADHEFAATTLEPPLGSGPYRVESVDPGRAIVYRRAPDYWGRHLAINRGQNNFDTVRYEYFRDADVLMEAFKAGEYDLRREASAVRWATAYDFPAAAEGRLKREMLAHQRPAGMHALVFNTRREVFADPRVREALGYAFDFEWINKTLLHGAYARTASIFAGSELAPRELPQGAELALLGADRARLPDAVFGEVYQPPATDGSGNVRANLRLARDLLAEAGWAVEGGTLSRTRDGLPLTFKILLVRPDNEKIALAFADNLARLGIEVRVRTVDSAQYQQRRGTFDFDMIVHHWRVSLSPGNEQAFYWGSVAADEQGSRNYAGIRDPVVDGLIEAVTAAHDRESLVGAIRAMDRVLAWGHYVIPLYHLAEDRVAYWDVFGRPEITPTYGYVVETWWTDPAKAAALGR